MKYLYFLELIGDIIEYFYYCVHKKKECKMAKADTAAVLSPTNMGQTQGRECEKYCMSNQPIRRERKISDP